MGRQPTCSSCWTSVVGLQIGNCWMVCAGTGLQQAGQDLRAIFALLRKATSGHLSAKSQELLQTLTIMAQHEDATAFFNFGGDAADILRNTELPYPGKGQWRFG